MLEMFAIWLTHSFRSEVLHLLMGGRAVVLQLLRPDKSGQGWKFRSRIYKFEVPFLPFFAQKYPWKGKETCFESWRTYFPQNHNYYRKDILWWVCFVELEMSNCVVAGTILKVWCRWRIEWLVGAGSVSSCNVTWETIHMQYHAWLPSSWYAARAWICGRDDDVV